MLSGLYSAASGMNSAATRQDILARNLAHANMPGFKRTHISFESFGTGGGQEAADNFGVRPTRQLTDHTQGAITQTGRKLDVAIAGDGYFVVEGPNGPLYTRNGVFHRSPAGGLVTSDGYAVAGTGSILPTMDTDGLNISREGNISVNGQPLGQLEIVAFNDATRLVPAGTTLFSKPAGMLTRQADVELTQGAREMSNVNSVTELVQMMTGMRHHESSSKAFQILADAIQKHTNAGAR